jgi:hypothetical protein
MISICFTKFPLGGLGERNIYHQSVCFAIIWLVVETGYGILLINVEFFPVNSYFFESP